MVSCMIVAMLYLCVINIFVNGSSKDENLCPICYEILQNCTTLPCNHVLCFQCFTNCVLQNIHKCPICRDPKFLNIVSNYTPMFISDILPFQNLTQNEKALHNILYVCISQTNFELYEYLYTQYNVILSEIQDENGNTFLHNIISSSFSSSEQKLEFFKYLIEEKNENVEIRNVYKATLLHHAVQFAEPEIAKYLLKNNFVNKNAQDQNFNTPIMHLISSNFYETEEEKLSLLTYFVEIACAHYCLENDHQMTPLFLSAIRGHFMIFLYLFQFSKTIPDNILFYVMTSPRMDEDTKLLFTQFIFKNTKINIHNFNEKGETIFHLCSYFGQTKILNYLLNFVEINFQDKLGNPALNYAIASPELSDELKFKMLDFFIQEKHADVNFENSEKISPFYVSIISGNLKIIKYFVKNTNANANLLDIEDHNALMQVLVSESIPEEDDKLILIKYLMAKTNVQIEGKNNTVMHLAAHFGFIKIIEFFIQNTNLTLHCKNSKEETPFMCIFLSDDLHHSTKLNVAKHLINSNYISKRCKESILISFFHLGYGQLSLSLLKKFEKENLNVNKALKELLSSKTDFYQNTKLELFKILVEKYDAEISKTILHTCGYHSEVEVLQYLLEEMKIEIDIDQTNFEGNTLVMDAILGHEAEIPEYRILKTVKYLVEKHNASETILNYLGYSPLQLSLDYNLQSVVEFLCRSNSPIDMQNLMYLDRYLTDEVFDSNGTYESKLLKKKNPFK